MKIKTLKFASPVAGNLQPVSLTTPDNYWLNNDSVKAGTEQTCKMQIQENLNIPIPTALFTLTAKVERENTCEPIMISLIICF